jgi:acyl-CoA dehydrogenase
VLEGRKAFVGNGGIAAVHLVSATVEPELGPDGQATFIVPGDNPGLRLIRKLEKLGCRASHHAEIGFENCRVPADHLLGTDDELDERFARGRERQAAQGDGEADRRATPDLFERTRPLVAAQAVGVARAALEYARDYATEREVFGGPIMEYDGIAFPLADLAAEIDSARMLTWRAAWMAANRVDFVEAVGSMAKLAASEVAVRASEAAMQTLAGWGYASGDHPVEKWYRDARFFKVYEGASEIQRRTVGRSVGARRGERPVHHRRSEAGRG